MALRRLLQRRMQSRLRESTGLLVSTNTSRPVEDLCTRQFAVAAVKDAHKLRQDAVQRLTEASKISWRLRADVKRIEQSLPSHKGKRFYNRRVVEVLEQGDLNRAWAVIVTLHQRHSDKAVLWPYTYNLVLRHYCNQQKTLMNMNLARILALLDVMVAQSCADRTSFEVAMAACSRARHLRSARHVLEKMNDCGQIPNARIYGYLINCCARKQGCVETAERYFTDMLTAGVKPTVMTVNALLRVYSRDVRRSTMMLDLLERARFEFGVASDTVTTRTMVYYLLSEGDVENAVIYMLRIERESSLKGLKKLPFNRQVVNSLIDACRQRGDWKSAQSALRILRQIDEKDVAVRDKSAIEISTRLANLVEKRDASSPAVIWAVNELDCSRMAQAHQKAYFLSRSQDESVKRALERNNAKTSLRKTQSSISRLSLRLEEKVRVLDTMIRSKIAIVDDFNAVLGYCGRQGRLAEAKTILKKMVYYSEMLPQCAPTTWSYNALLNACAARGDVHEIDSTVNDMIENGLQPDQVTMNTVLKAYKTNLRKNIGGNSAKRLSTVGQALSFFEWCNEDLEINPDATTYYSLFRLFTAYLEIPDDSSVATTSEVETTIFNDVKGEEEECIEGQEVELMAWMTEFIVTTCRDAPNIALNIGVFNNAFDYYQRLGDVDGSFALYDIMRKREIQPNDTTLGLLFATCASQQQFEKGLLFLDHLMTIDGYKPTLKVLTGAMQLCANAKNPDKVLEIFRAIETSRAFTLTIDTYEPVVFAFARVGDVTSAWAIANEVEEKFGRVSINIYNRILLACVEAALPGCALEALRVACMKENVRPNVISYNTALEAFVRAGERAAWWRKNNNERMEYDEVSGDGEVLSTKNCSDAKANQMSDDWREDMACSDSLNETIGFKGDKLEAALSKDHDFRQRTKAAWVRANVIGMLEEMQKTRVKPDMTTYERAIAACSVNEDSEGVIAIFDRLICQKRCDDIIDLKGELISESSFTAYLVACTILQDKHRIVGAPSLLHKWHLATGQVPPEFVVTQLLKSLETLGEWRCAVRMLPQWQVLFGVQPRVDAFNKVMEMCNRAGEHQLVAPIFVTMLDSTAYRIFPDAESYIQRIYAEEQQENWVAATNLFVEMQKRFSSEEITHHQLQKLNLGRYSLRQIEH